MPSDPRQHRHFPGEIQYWRHDSLWGVGVNGRWTWMMHDSGRWWAVTSDQEPVLWHQNRWWWRSDGIWFMLHQGEPWAYRWFHRWKLEGLTHPQTNTHILYSTDGAKAAIVASGQPVSVFNLQTGREIGRWNSPNTEASDP